LNERAVAILFALHFLVFSEIPIHIWNVHPPFPKIQHACKSKINTAAIPLPDLPTMIYIKLAAD